MSKGRKILIALALLVILGGITFALTYDREPTYAGHTLSFWLRNVDGPDAEEEIQAIGTNAIPYLVRWIGEEPPGWKRQLAKLPLVRRNDWLLAHLYGDPDYALVGFAILHTNAAPAIPALVTILNDTTRPGAGLTAMTALAYIGEQALPPLAAVLSETNTTRRFYAINSISHMPDHGTQKTACLVPLLKATTDPDPVLRTFATNAIHRIAPELLTNSPAAGQPPHR